MIVPSSVAKILPAEGVQFYEQSFTKLYNSLGSEELAHEGAWTLTRARMRVVGEELVACSEDFIAPQLFQFALQPAEEILIKNHDDGTIELDAVLATTEARRSDGKAFDEEALHELARQINEEGSTFPDVDHAILAKLAEKYGPDADAIKANIKREKGVFNRIKAAVKDGKLWIKAFLDKRYKNYVERFSNLSIEAFATPVNGRLTKPKYLGFTFTNTPQLAGAQIAS